MKAFDGSMITLASYLLVLFPVVNLSSDVADQDDYGGAPNTLDRRPLTEGMDRVVLISALDPEEARRQRDYPADEDRPVLREREAVLRPPVSGRELVDSVMARETQERSITQPILSTAERPPWVHSPPRVAERVS